MKTLIGSDVHGEHANIPFVKKFISFGRDWQPDTVIFPGDILDCGAWSKFLNVPGSEDFAGKELPLMAKFFQSVRRNMPNSRIIYIIGNHEHRIRQRILEFLPTADGLKALTLDSMLGLDNLGIEVVDQPADSASWIGSYVMDQGYAIGHFKRVSKHSGYTAKGLMDDFWCSVVQGHVHRAAIISKRALDGKIYYGVESGCMCDLSPSYMLHANWENTFVTIEDGYPELKR